MQSHGEPTLNPSRLRWAVLAPLAAAALVACGGGGSNSSGADGDNGSNSGGEQTASACPETGTYACKSGETEPLYTFQWALNYAKSWFMDNADAGAYGGGMDLNVEPVHKQGIKGQGVNVLVIDTGVDLANEDLKDNAAPDLSWNYATNSNDPSPQFSSNKISAHGTMVAGIIGAAQNGKGVMGIAPQAKLGGVPLIETGQWSTETLTDAFGGAAWSQRAHIINGSFGGGTRPLPYARPGNALLASIQSLKSLRDGKGVVFVKSAGNSFNYEFAGGNQLNYCGPLRNSSACINPGNDSMGLPPNVILTAALNAKGQASNYSSSGSVVWITGLAGEHGAQGSYGEKSGLSPEDIASGRTGDGPTLFSTDIRGCAQGSSRNVNNSENFINTAFMRGESVRKDVKDNPNCDYAYMNGTSAAAPSITGVVALMLSANPDLTWRDVRDILRLSARALDQGYEQRKRSDITATLPTPYNALFDLKTNTLLTQSGGAEQIKVGSTQAPLELGWTTNAAGLKHSNWYGFGVPDAAKAVELAKLYKKEPARSKPAAQAEPDFTTVNKITSFEYQTTTLLGEYEAGEQTVDAFQLRLTGSNVCLGSLGLAVESPSGTKSLLKMPLDNFAQQGISSFTQYGAGSYAFYGESAKGKWKIYAIASNPVQDPRAWLTDQISPATCTAAPAAGSTIAPNATLTVEARVIAQ